MVRNVEPFSSRCRDHRHLGQCRHPCSRCPLPFQIWSPEPNEGRQLCGKNGNASQRKSLQAELQLPFPTSLWIDAKSFIMVKVTSEFGGRILAVEENVGD